MMLRDYQQTMVDAVRRHWAAGRHRVLGCLPTGGGKTEVAIQIITEVATPVTRALVIVERKVLCHQWVARLRRHGLSHVGVLQGDNTIALSAPVIVATAQSIRSRGVPEGVTLIVIDESHIWHQTHDKVMRLASGARVLGLTATPLRDGLGLRFDTMVVGATIRTLIEAGNLVRPRYFAPARTDIQDALDKVAIRAGDYATDQLSMVMRSKAIIGDVVGTWQRRGEDRQTIAFCVDKAHARDLCDEFLAAGIAARTVVDDTEDDDRVQIFRAFDERQVRILVLVGVLSIGFDSPVASCAILARPTMSTSLHIQQGGRVLRPFDGKTDALILDHACNTLRHGLLEAFVPPSNLSQTDKATGGRTRKDRDESWVCRGCNAINALQENICGECGLPRRRQTAAVVVDGELIEVDASPGVVLPGPTLGDLQEFYRMARWHAAAKGLNDGWAYYAAQRRFKLEERAAKALIPWRWKAHAPLVPNLDASRWFRADFQRSRVASRHREQRQSHA